MERTPAIVEAELQALVKEVEAAFPDLGLGMPSPEYLERFRVLREELATLIGQVLEG